MAKLKPNFQCPAIPWLPYRAASLSEFFDENIKLKH